MTAQATTGVLCIPPRLSGPSQAALDAVRALLDADEQFTPQDIAGMAKKAGIGHVVAKVAATVDREREIGQSHSTASYFITKWDVFMGGQGVGYIRRKPEHPATFYAYSVNPKRMKGASFSRIRDAVMWLLQDEIPWEQAAKLAQRATIEEGMDPGEFVQSFKTEKGLIRRLEPQYDIKVGSREEALRRAEEDYAKIQGGVFHVYEMMSNETGDTVESVAPDDSPFLVRVVGGDVERVQDNFVDPYWDVEILEDHPALPNPNSGFFWIDGQSYEFPERVREAQEVTPREIFKDSMKPQLTHDEDGEMAILIPSLQAITPEQWNTISRRMVQKGYDSRGGTDAARAVQSMFRRRSESERANPRLLTHDVWVEVIADVLGLKAPSRKPDGRGGAAMARKVFARAVRGMGITSSPSQAGYILPDGSLLDFSGGRGNLRTSDHREVGAFLDDRDHSESPTENMEKFQDLGAIRWTPEANGFDLRVPPTANQVSTMREIIREINQTGGSDSIHLDVYSPRYGKAGANYPSRTEGYKVTQDIQTFYKTGFLPGQSEVQQFHAMGEAVVARLLGEDENDQLDLPFAPDAEVITDLGISPEDIAVGAGVINKYEQIGGDFGDPWVFGGTWYSAYVEKKGERWDTIYHIDGLEGEGKEDYDAGSKAVKKALEEPENAARIQQLAAEILPKKLAEQGYGRYPDADPAEEADTKRWCEREALDDAKNEVADKVAEDMNMNRKLTVYRTNADDPYENDQEAISQTMRTAGMTAEQWVALSPADKVVIWADEHGWYELDHQPAEMTKAELEEKIGVDL